MPSECFPCYAHENLELYVSETEHPVIEEYVRDTGIIAFEDQVMIAGICCICYIVSHLRLSFLGID
tara:strand:- start:718 stop:915 length:198 start_codon:yes stop_codon:yes gene_type:complete